MRQRAMSTAVVLFLLAGVSGCDELSEDDGLVVPEDQLDEISSEIIGGSACNGVSPSWSTGAQSFDHTFEAPYGATLCPGAVRISWNNARQRYVSVQVQPWMLANPPSEAWCEAASQQLVIWRYLIGGNYQQVDTQQNFGIYSIGTCGGGNCLPPICTFLPLTSDPLAHCDPHDPNRCGIAYRIYAGARSETVQPNTTLPIRVRSSTSSP